MIYPLPLASTFAQSSALALLTPSPQIGSPISLRLSHMSQNTQHSHRELQMLDLAETL